MRNCKLNSANIKKFQKSQLSLRMNSLLSVASPFNSTSKGFCYSYSRSHHLFGSKGMAIVLGKHLRSKFLVQDQKRQPQDVYGNAKYRIETQFYQLYCSCLGNLQYTINSHEVKIGGSLLTNMMITLETLCLENGLDQHSGSIIDEINLITWLGKVEYGR